ncbi:MAG: hypothetical protein ACFFCO_04490 [Promethearchaeota archaeon]
MVKHPKYQAMDDARQEAIPRAFERFCGKEYRLEEEEPYRPSVPLAGPIPRPRFHIFHGKERVATFHPNGYAEHFDKDFLPIFERMRGMIEVAAQQAYEEFERGGEPPRPPEQPHFPE